MRRNVLVLFVVSALFTGPALAQQASDPYLITPGVGIGPITVGMSITDATRILGTPKPAITKLRSIVLPVPDGALAFEWAPSPEARRQGAGDHDGLHVITDRAGTIFEIQAPFDTRFHTADGLRIGSKPEDATRTLGTPSRETTYGHERFLIYDRRGIALLIQTNRQIFNYGLVNGIWVFAPR